MTLSKSLGQFVKFAVVGVANTAVDWIIFFLLKLLPFFVLNRPLAKAISFVFAAINSYFLNSLWTFRSEYKSGFKANDKHRLLKNSVYFGRFLSVSLVGWAINVIIYTMSINILNNRLPERFIDLSALVAASFAGLVWNFLANKLWTYKKVEIAPISNDEKLKRRWFNLIGTILLSFMAIISFFVMRGDSGIVDEIAHIPAGYSYIKYHDFRLNPEHPPLAKALAGVPLAFTPWTELSNSAAWDDINQWEAGWDFIYRLGNNADLILLLSRLPIIILTLILGYYIYRFSAELFGRKVAVFCLLLYSFYPEFLAHGHLVTTDIAAALGFFISAYYFYHWSNHQTRKSLIFLVIALAIANLLKFSAVLLIPISFIYLMILAKYKRQTGEKYLYSLWRFFKPYFAVWILAFFLIWLFYLPMTWSTPSGIEHQLIENNLTTDIRTLGLRNFLHLFENNPILRALGHFLLGIMLVFGRVGGGNATYIFGQFSDKSISWYFPVAYLVKTPTAIIILLLISICYYIWSYRKSAQASRYISFIFLVPIAIYWLVTLKGSLNIGIRHLMPTVPFVILFIGQQFRQSFSNIKSSKILLPGILSLWLIISVLLNYPHYISYFNESSLFKPRHEMLVDSSLDWGQDLLRLRDYAKENNIKNIKIDYFGGSVPGYYIPDAVSWRSGYGPTTGHIAISATFYQFSKMYGKIEGKWSYDWLDEYQPEAIIGNSILVFDIKSKDFINNPPSSPYPITKYDFPESNSSLSKPILNN